MSGHHFDKHTALVFTKNITIIRKLTNYVVKGIKSTEKGVSGHHLKKTQHSLSQKTYRLLEDLHSMLFKESS